MDQGFHLRLHFFTIGQHDLRRIRLDGTTGHAVESLLNDADALSHLEQTHFVSAPAIAAVRDRHLELELLVTGVRHVTPKVEINARSSHRGPGDSKSNRILCGKVSNPHQSIAED